MEMENVFVAVNTKFYVCQLLILNYFADFVVPAEMCSAKVYKVVESWHRKHKLCDQWSGFSISSCSIACTMTIFLRFFVSDSIPFT